ncbi:4-(cytidine 5'-diphospho)-2-C-methyl-D-erythritol kinase [Thalassobacterium maritimum]|nr:4-(cytidine 5'-diphospho)-2-C-methyl-D-erythritol kinase [Coraliomargarita sp. SDUM461003]
MAKCKNRNFHGTWQIDCSYWRRNMNSVSLDSPAKINLMLSVHGPREDGFHALTSLVVALSFGDRLVVTRNQLEQDRLQCQDTAVPTGEGNLIIRAAAAFRAHVGKDVFFDFELDKRIPMGAGLGGGSSNAAVALTAMNQLLGLPLKRERLLILAASLGSDCPFFIDSVPTVMSGRGEVLEPLSTELASSLRGQRVLLFKPDFGVNTAWAYRQLIEASPTAYEPEALAHARLERFASTEAMEHLLMNSFEAPIGAKYLAIQCLLEELRERGIRCLMSGSGSCCFALPKDDSEMSTAQSICQNALGSGVFLIETSIR